MRLLGTKVAAAPPKMGKFPSHIGISQPRNYVGKLHKCLNRWRESRDRAPQRLRGSKVEERNRFCWYALSFAHSGCVKSRIFASLCKELGAEHETSSIYCIGRYKGCQVLTHWRDPKSCCANLADRFHHLNELNTQRQGQKENLLKSREMGVLLKVQLWEQQPWVVPTHRARARSEHLLCPQQDNR